MTKEIARSNWKKYLINFIGLFILYGNSLVQGVEWGPITWGRDALRAGGINTPQTILPGNRFYNL